jgi:hypothetical protein
MKMTSTQRFAVRTALVTSSTLATLIGAQALASLDETTLLQATPQAVIAPAELNTQSAVGLQPTAVNGAAAAAPTITILRHAGVQPSTSQTAAQPGTTSAQPPVIVRPPNPVQVAPPQPVQVVPPQPVQVAPPQAVVQQAAPAAPRTRSSR